MNILITGGAGFIGKALHERLIELGHTTISVDYDLRGLTLIDGYYRYDLSENFDTMLKETIEDVDVIYHLASSIGVEKVKDPETIFNSMKINLNFFEALKKSNAKVIYASSSEVYGSSRYRMKEDQEFLQVRSPIEGIRGAYSAQKILGEHMTKAYGDSGKKYNIVRFFNVVGKGQRDDIGMVLPNFVNAALRNEPLTVYGGNEMRSYCDIRDAVNMLVLLLDNLDNEIVNIGADNVRTTLALAEEVKDILNSSSEIKILPHRKEEIENRVPDISKILKIYKHKYSLRDTILDMVSE